MMILLKKEAHVKPQNFYVHSAVLLFDTHENDICAIF